MEPTTAAVLILQELKKRTDQDQIAKLYPDDGPLRRELYSKHIEMLFAGSEHNIRTCLGGNRVGKTYSIGGFETALHLTGQYPSWWEGCRYDRPILAWASGTKAVKTRDINQKYLLGDLHRRKGFTQATGGLIPAARIIRLTRKSGVTDAVDTATIRHINGFDSTLNFKSAEEGRQAFEGEAIDWGWIDEEHTKEIHDELFMRILTTRGRLMFTFTPILGMTPATMSLLKGSGLI